MSATLDHYNRTAARYAEVNHSLPSASVDRDAFLDQLRAQPELPEERTLRLLDAGSGSGRDTLCFLAEGFEVDAFDGSAAMAEVSSRHTGRPTRVMCFEDLDLPTGHYDAIWAMASLLHVDRALLPQVIVDLGRSLRPGGLFFSSFKQGQADRVDARDGRVFTDLDADGVRALLTQVEGLELIATSSRAPPPGQINQEPWFSCVLRRPGPEPRLLAQPAHRARVRP